MIISVSPSGSSYDIILERGAIGKVKEYIPLSPETRVLIVTDSGVPSRYVRAVADAYEKSVVFTFPMGEKSKNFDTYKNICQTLLDNSFTRKDAVIAVGGGVSGDMAGFAAATYMRGIDFYNIPTTLLSQVDSSIGGKTAIDFGQFKNIIGAFYQPKGVIIDPDVLGTLDRRQLLSGLAESIKVGVTMDAELFELIEKGEPEKNIEKIIELSLKVKKYVVEQDEREAGLRKVLNFGHTIGHAVESASEGELYHGECVAMGMLPMCSPEIRERLRQLLIRVGLPTCHSADRERIYEALTHDKKSEGELISAVISNRIGSFEFRKMSAEELMKLI